MGLGARPEPADLAWAATLGNMEVVAALLGAGVAVNAKDAHGQSALDRAAGAGHLDVVKALLEAKAHANR